MRDFFDEFFAPEFLGFGKPTKVIFNTNGIKDQMPSYWDKTDDGYKATVKTLGIEKAEIEVKECGIRVSGKNEIDGKKYDTVVDLPIAEKVMDSVLEIKHKTTAGITVVNLIVDKPRKREVKIVNE